MAEAQCRIRSELENTKDWGTFMRFYQGFSFSEVKSSAENGCECCEVLLQGLRHFHSNVDEAKSVAPKANHPGGPLQVHYYPVAWLSFYTLEGKPCKWATIGAARPEHVEATHPESIRTMQAWINRCVNQHPKCSPIGSSLPTRVVAVGGGDIEPYIYESGRECAQYVALSHCWGRKQMFTTTTATLGERKRRIPIDTLPRTFREAILVTRSLGIPYIWIDSLCILQDSKDDWAIESARMSSVYSNAIVTLAADGSPDSHGGLSKPSPSNLDATRAFTIPLPGDNNVYVCKGLIGDSSSHFEKDQPLQDRAWVFQERVLSRRIIHFTTTKMIWECKEEVCSETSFFPSRGEDTGSFFSLQKQHDYSWSAYVNEYTRKQLTYTTDRLAAIAGVADTMKENASADYVGGLWRSELPLSLCWEINRYGSDPPNLLPSRRQQQYCAPSWSWASVIHSITSGYIPPRLSDDRPVSEVLEVDFTLETRNPFGNLEKGHITLRGPLIPVALSDRNTVPHHGFEVRPLASVLHIPSIKHAWEFKQDVDEPEYESSRDTPLFALVISVGRETQEEAKGVVLKHSEGDNAYTRVGALNIVRYWSENSQHARWDLSELEPLRKVVKII
ncbi:heterokaryon incompatibility protein-domain-containing protein [Biscogniauxia marginata]|nr:heterokaryon incompatibility protein-domain-containing protein [Biscogniauxia marginata]